MCVCVCVFPLIFPLFFSELLFFSSSFSFRSCFKSSQAMLPQLNIAGGNEPRHGGGAVHASSNENSSCSDCVSAGQASCSSSKFEEAMEMYHQSMAIRRRKMSISDATMPNLESNGLLASAATQAYSAESTTPHLSASLRGPQLRPTTRLTRVLDSSCGSPPQQRAGYRLPSLFDHHHHHDKSNNNDTADVSTANRPAALTGEKARNGLSAESTAVVRRSTRRPLSSNRALSPLASVATSRDKSRHPFSDPSSSSSSSFSRRSSVADGTDGVQRQPSLLSGGVNSVALEGTDSALGSFQHLTRLSSDNEQSQATKHPSVFHSQHSSRSSSNRSSYSNASHNDDTKRKGSAKTQTPAPRHQPLAGVKSEALQDLSGGSYSELSLGSVLNASEDVLTPIRRFSLYAPAQPRTPTTQQPQQQQAQPAKPKAPQSRPTSTTPRRYSLTYGSAAASISLLLSEPSSPPSAPTVTTVEKPSKTSVPLLPQSAAATAVRLPSSSTATTTGSTKYKMDATGRSVSQGGLSSAANISESCTGSRATCETPPPRLHTPTTAVGEASSASPNSTNAPHGHTGTTTEATPVAAATAGAGVAKGNPIDMLPVPSAPTPALTSMADKQTAQFYNTASLAKTYDGSQFLNDYILLSEIGSGATGRVVLAFSTSMMCSVAIKIILKPKEKKYRLQRTCGSSDSSAAVSNVSERRSDGAEAGGDASNSGQPARVSTPVPSHGRYGEAKSIGTALDTVATATPSRRKNVPNTRLTTAERMAHNLKREIEVMKDLNHPNIVRLYEVINDPKANSLFLILQYVDSGAVAQLNSSGCIANPFSPDDLLPIATQVVDGLVYLHEHRIVHRDIKPENILVNRDGQAFLADFGVAELMNAESGLPTAATLAYQGTPLFMAPEIYALDDDNDDELDLLHVDVNKAGSGGGGTHDKKTITTTMTVTGDGGSITATTTNAKAAGHASPRTIDPYALDVWALGVTFYTLLTGHVPFHSMLQIRQTVHTGVDIPQNLPEAWRNVLRCTMEPDVSRRVSSAQLQRILHAMRDDTAGAARLAGSSRGVVAQKDAMLRGVQSRSRGPMRQPPASAAARLAKCASDDENVILGSGTPTDPLLLRANDGRVADDMDDFDCNFSINSSVLDVLRPVRQ